MNFIRILIAALPLLALVACGGGVGGGTPGNGPAIQGFSAGTTTLFVGERARLTASFSGGQGRIEPGIGPVQSGVPVLTPPLDANRRYTLVVEAAGQPAARRDLDLAVGYRDRYQQLPVPFLVQYHAAVTTADGTALVIGGSRGTNVLSDAIDRFDPVTGGFTRIGTLRTGRGNHTATRLADGRILVLGGNVSVDIGAVADVIDPRTGAVSGGGTLQLPRHRHATVALADGRALVVGGSNRNTVELWDPATSSFRLVAARMSHVREYPTATLLADGRVLIAGGYTVAPTYVFAEVFDPRTETFAPVAAAVRERRYFHTAHRLRNGKVLLAGGETADDATGAVTPLASVLEFDPALGTLTLLRALDTARTLAAAVQSPDDDLLLFGGDTPGAAPTASAAGYRAAAPRSLATMPQARAFHTATRMGDGRVLIVGGDDARGDPVSSVLIYE